MDRSYTIHADLTYLDGEFRPDIVVSVGGSGYIEHMDSSRHPADLRLQRQVLLPGMVNAHSHAFQRALRGRGERFPRGQGDFWSWREAMYDLAEHLTADELRHWCLAAFGEMLEAGITTVGEFHYLRHGPDAARYTFDEVVLDAARETGIRMVLLLAFYKTGGISRPLTGAQQRFATPSVSDFWAQFDALSRRIDPATQSLGIAPHSIRAAPLEDLVALFAEARRRGIVVHMHVAEQSQEVSDCAAAYGVSPLDLCAGRLGIDSSFTAVHATHCTPEEIARFAQSGAGVCLCPLTEANLGDGVPDLVRLQQGGTPLCLGTDSNAHIDMFEEQRWLEYGQRLARRSRGVFRDADGGLAVPLFRCATENGARSLGLPAGRIQPGKLADFFTLELDHPRLAGWTPETLLDATIIGCGAGVVRRVCVGGQWIKSDGV